MKDITFPTFTVAKYIDPWTLWVPACSQTQVLFIVGILSLLTFNSAYHCRVLAVSLIFTHCTMVILEWTFMDPWTSWISYVSSIYILLFSSELWALIEGLTPSLIDIAVYRTYWYCRRFWDTLGISFIHTLSHGLIVSNPSVYGVAQVQCI